MASLREMRLRIRSVRNIAQVTRALQTVSASKVRHAQAAVLATRPYATKALEVLGHLAGRRNTIKHPMLTPRAPVRNILAIVVSGDRGLAGAYNASVVRRALSTFADSQATVHYIVIGRKGREMLRRAGVPITAEFSNLPPAPSYADLSPIGRLAIEEYAEGKADEVFIVFTQFINLIHQQTAVQQLLPLSGLAAPAEEAPGGARPVYLFEPGQTQLLDTAIHHLVSVEVYEIDPREPGQRTRGADGDDAQRHRERGRTDRRIAIGVQQGAPGKHHRRFARHRRRHGGTRRARSRTGGMKKIHEGHEKHEEELNNFPCTPWIYRAFSKDQA